MLDRFRRLRPADGDEVLLAHLELTGAIRRLPFMDPQLPDALLPNWIGREATRQLRELGATWAERANARWNAIVESTRPPG
jgi:phenylacetic acid degradation operon negative regulatory protein